MIFFFLTGWLASVDVIGHYSGLSTERQVPTPPLFLSETRFACMQMSRQPIPSNQQQKKTTQFRQLNNKNKTNKKKTVISDSRFVSIERKLIQIKH